MKFVTYNPNSKNASDVESDDLWRMEESFEASFIKPWHSGDGDEPAGLVLQGPRSQHAAVCAAVCGAVCLCVAPNSHPVVCFVWLQRLCFVHLSLAGSCYVACCSLTKVIFRPLVAG